jgi:hypothetical protein
MFASDVRAHLSCCGIASKSRHNGTAAESGSERYRARGLSVTLLTRGGAHDYPPRVDGSA